MEGLESNTREVIINPGYIKFAEEIKQKVIETFPFTTDEEKNAFSEEFNKVFENEKNVDQDSFIKNIRVALASLNNSHTCLEENNTGRKYSLENPIYYRTGKFWVDIEDKTKEVLSINDISIEESINEKRKEIGGGTTEWQINMILDDINSSEEENEVVLETTDGKIDTKFGTNPKRKKLIESKSLPDDIGYLKVASWSKKAKQNGQNVSEIIIEEFEKIKNNDSIIIDVRQNSGGSTQFAEILAGHFVDKPIKFATGLKRIPGEENLVERDFVVKPKGEFLDKKVVILTGPKCLSSNEIFILSLKDSGKAITIGENTGGGSGCPTFFDINLGNKNFTLSVSTWRLIRKNGQALEGQGIEPDVPVEIKPEDVINHKDVELETAMEYLTKNK